MLGTLFERLVTGLTMVRESLGQPIFSWYFKIKCEFVRRESRKSVLKLLMKSFPLLSHISIVSTLIGLTYALKGSLKLQFKSFSPEF